ncbi:hypothetical protein HQ560_06270, partial [bacterium]|nr:hypothetical protein [bacterium]
MSRLVMLLALALPLCGCPGLLDPHASPQGGGPSLAEAQAVSYFGPKARIAVVDFDFRAAKGEAQVGTGLSEMLVGELVRCGRFIVLERRALGQVMGEQDLGASGRVSPDSAAPIGEIEGAELLVTGIVSEFEPNY